MSNENFSEKIQFNPSAFKHGFSEEDILKAIELKIYEGPVEGFENKMAAMTDEEADALDELMTHTDLKLGPNGTGFFSNRGCQILAIDEDTARILNAQSIVSRQ